MNPKITVHSGGIDNADINKARVLLLKMAQHMGFIDLMSHSTSAKIDLGSNMNEKTLSSHLNEIRGISVTDTAVMDALLSCGEAKNGSEAGLLLRELMNFGFIRRKLTYNNSDIIGMGGSVGVSAGEMDMTGISQSVHTGGREEGVSTAVERYNSFNSTTGLFESTDPHSHGSSRSPSVSSKGGSSPYFGSKDDLFSEATATSSEGGGGTVHGDSSGGHSVAASAGCDMAFMSTIGGDDVMKALQEYKTGQDGAIGTVDGEDEAEGESDNESGFIDGYRRGRLNSNNSYGLDGNYGPFSPFGADWSHSTAAIEYLIFSPTLITGLVENDDVYFDTDSQKFFSTKKNLENSFDSPAMFTFDDLNNLAVEHKLCISMTTGGDTIFRCPTDESLANWIYSFRVAIEQTWLDHFLSNTRGATNGDHGYSYDDHHVHGQQDYSSKSEDNSDNLVTLDSFNSTVGLKVRADGPTKVLELIEGDACIDKQAQDLKDNIDMHGVDDLDLDFSNTPNGTKQQELNVSVVIESISFSVTDKQPEELFYFHIHDIQISAQRKKKSLSLAVTVQNIQLDNQLKEPVYRVAMYPRDHTQVGSAQLLLPGMYLFIIIIHTYTHIHTFTHVFININTSFPDFDNFNGR